MQHGHHTSGVGTSGTVIAVNVSNGGIPKQNLGQAEVTAEGLVGDRQAHEKHRRPHRAVTVQDVELLAQLAAEGHAVRPGTMGENLTVRGLNVQRLCVGDRLHFEHGPVLELAEVRKPCFVLDSVNPQLKHDVVGRCGYLCRVLQGGTFRVGQQISVTRQSAVTGGPGAERD